MREWSASNQRHHIAGISKGGKSPLRENAEVLLKNHLLRTNQMKSSILNEGLPCCDRFFRLIFSITVGIQSGIEQRGFVKPGRRAQQPCPRRKQSCLRFRNTTSKKCITKYFALMEPSSDFPSLDGLVCVMLIFWPKGSA